MALTEDMILTRSKLITASAETLQKILEVFGEQPKSSDRVKLVMEAEKLFFAEMAGEVAETALLAFQHSLGGKETSTVKTDTVDDKAAAPSVGSVKVHKDFRLTANMKSYTSFIRQIEARLKKGHSEDDIIDGVIRAVIPVFSLKSYLDGRQDMSLPTLRRILRAHYAEKNSTELYTELASSVQSAKETGSEFLMRTMDLRNKILFASLENSDELKYSPDFVYKLFARTVQTGFRDQILRQEMKAILADSTKTDAKLLDELNKIVRREHENKQKVGKAVVASMKSDETSVASELLKEIKALKVEVAQLKEASQPQKGVQTEAERRRNGQARRYSRCQEQNRRCHHRWSCGSEGHQQRNCSKPLRSPAGRGSSGSKNEQGPS